MITWNKERMGMGYRSRRCCEYLVVIQKIPKLAKKTWTRHDIRDCYSEKVDRKLHPHVKPVGLIGALIDATCPQGSLVVDPCAGSWQVMQACEVQQVNFAGTDIVSGEIV